MAAGKVPSPTPAQCNPRSYPGLQSSFSHGSPSFPRDHADQGGRPSAGSAAAHPHSVSPRLGGGDGGSRGGAGWSILESWRPGVSGGGAARGGVDGAPRALLTCRVCSRSFHGVEALQLHMKICPPAPAAAVEPPALLPQQGREKRPSMGAWARTRPHEPAWEARSAHGPTVLEFLRSLFWPWLREEHLALPCFAEFVSAAQKILGYEAPLATPAAFSRGSAAAGAGVTKGGRYVCKKCGETFKSGQALGGHMTGRHPRPKDGPSLARVPAANNDISSPPGMAGRKRPAMEAASPGNGKRRCIRLFGVDIVVEAPKE